MSGHTFIDFNGFYRFFFILLYGQSIQTLTKGGGMMNNRFYLSDDIKTALNSLFGVKMLMFGNI